MPEPSLIPMRDHAESQIPQLQIHGGRSAMRRALQAGKEGFTIVNRYRILIVDDDAMAREILRRSWGNSAKGAMTPATGPEAWRRRQEGSPPRAGVDLR